MKQMVETGCDVLLGESCASLAGARVGLLANPASVSSSLQPTLGAFVSRGVRVARVFGPQHGFHGETQANMIEWAGFTHPRFGMPVHSLYGERREPDPAWLEGLDVMVIDLPDVGARPYTYLWTALLAHRACARAGVETIVLDRPNPIGGEAIEGAILGDGFRSFVGLAAIPLRHGLTIGEALAMIAAREGTGASLRVVAMRGWRRSMLFDETGLPWVLPSPNMPTPDTALVYPGAVLLEGTNLSEGRGTTRPFEIVGAPWLDPEEFAEAILAFGVPGAVCRPLRFVPTWDKYAGEACGGVQAHVTDRRAFRPVRFAVAAIDAARRARPDRFAWKQPPYEYERTLAPIDILSGDGSLRTTIDAAGDAAALLDGWRLDEERFARERRPYLMYA